MNSEESAELLALAEKHGVNHGVNFNYRQQASVQNLQAKIANGDLGKVNLIHESYLLAVKPLIDVPEDLREVLGKHVYLVRGGHEFDGREIVSLDEEHLYRIAEEIKGQVD